MQPWGTRKITEVIIEEGETKIGRYAFQDCFVLTKITIPKSVNKIDIGAFAGCTLLKRIYITDITSWCNIEFSPTNLLYSLFLNGKEANDIVIPDAVWEIKAWAFSGCTGLKRVTLSNGIMSIGNSAFSGCTGLESITIPDSVIEIGEEAFDGCNIKKLNITEGSKAVTGTIVVCKDTLEEVNIPNSVTNIAAGAFSDCKYLVGITIPDSVESVGMGAWSQSKAPTCTETGVESGKCGRCGQTTTNVIKAKGHKFGAWKDTKPATCTEGGTKERKCTDCGAAETKTTEALGHDFENPTIVKAATISKTGLKEGKCKRCGETASEVIPCTARDEATGTLFEANEGVFPAGTELTVEEIKTDNPIFDSANNILKDICNEFKLYNIKALLNGAEVTPNGKIAATFNIPDGYGRDIALYLIKSDGTNEKLDCEISEDGHTLSAKLNELGDYAICKLGDGENTSKTEDDITLEKPENNNMAVYIIITVCGVVLIGGVVSFVVIKKKRK